MMNVYTSAIYMSSFFYPWYKFLYSRERFNIPHKNVNDTDNTAKKCLFFMPFFFATGCLLPRLLFFHDHFVS